MPDTKPPTALRQPQRLSILALPLAPSITLIALFFCLPFALLVEMSFRHQSAGSLIMSDSFTLDNYRAILGKPIYLRAIANTVALAGGTVAISLLLALPCARLIVRSSGVLRAALILLTLLPTVSGSLVQTLGLVNLLSPLGVINGTLRGLGIIRYSIPFLGHDLGVLIGLVQAFLPLMILPLVEAMGRMPADVEDAARLLGASRAQVWWCVILPLARPGMIAGGMLVFFAALTSFVTPQLLGQGRVQTIGTVMYQQAILVDNWPLASAFAVLLVLASAAIRTAVSYLRKVA